MPEIAPVTTPSTPATRTDFTVDTSSLKLNFDISTLQTKVDKVLKEWNEKNLELVAEAQMYQIRNKNIGSTLESTTKDHNLTGDVTISVPTKDGKELQDWRSMPSEQKNAMWKEAISGNKYEKDSKGQWVVARDSGGQLIKSDLKIGQVEYNKMGGWKAVDYLVNYEGMQPGTAARAKNGDSQTDIDNARSQNQTMINNIMTSNSNMLSQATTQSNYAITQLNTALSTIQQLLTDFFNLLKQSINNTTA